jgi:hypothetical protein
VPFNPTGASGRTQKSIDASDRLSEWRAAADRVTNRAFVSRVSSRGRRRYADPVRAREAASKTRWPIVFAAGLALFGMAAAYLASACSGGGDSEVDSFGGGAFGGTSAGASGASGASGTGGATSGTGGADALDDGSVPTSVACTSSSSPEASVDASAEAEAEADASPCDTPPPSRCATAQRMFEYASGPCVKGFCAFKTVSRECAGGCFKQIDGGFGCNE